jgi:hypothetical protein
VDTETRRDGRSSVTNAEGSGGGSAISASGGPAERTTIAQGGSGDIYAGHDGNVYRKTEDGWQQHGDGGWSGVETPERPAGAERGGLTEAPRYGGSGSLESRGSRDAYGGSPGANGTGSRPATSNTQQLNRDAAARNGGYQNHQRRTAPRSTGMSRGARPRRR